MPLTRSSCAFPPARRRSRAPGVALVSLALTGLVFSALGVITGVWAETFDQHSFVANIVITPLALAGAVFYSAGTLPEPWQTLTRFDDLLLGRRDKAGFTGFHESPLWLSLVVTALVAVAAFATASTLLARGWRLKP
jgi:ABC-2 type transport system permease protein